MFLVFILAAPLIAEVLRNLLNDPNQFAWSRLAGISPIGVLILTWGDGAADPVPGIAVQIAVAMTLAMLFHLTGNSKAALTPPVAPLPA